MGHIVADRRKISGFWLLGGVHPISFDAVKSSVSSGSTSGSDCGIGFARMRIRCRVDQMSSWRSNMICKRMEMLVVDEA